MSKTSNTFETSNEFSFHIESLAKSQKLGYIDALLKYCSDNFIDPEDVGDMVNKSLKDKLEVEMRELNLLPKLAQIQV